MSNVVFDLENILDPELPPPPKAKREGEPDPFAPPLYWQIVSAAAVVLSPKLTLERILLWKTEPEAVDGLIAELSARDAMAVTWNGRGFDLPVLAARAFKLGRPFPAYYKGKPDMRYRYGNGTTFDMKDYLGDFGGARAASMDVYAKAMGLPGKGDCDGSMVGDMIAAGRHAEVYVYNLEDALQEACIFLRVEWISGRMPESTYRKALDGLLADAKVMEPLLAPFVEKAQLSLKLRGQMPLLAVP